ncbi:uncharacterized protein C2845_PM07G05450 [Panicum miliaceum]|uniref:FBD domain-containing protein n=1 Tax=Panicum miliaceum TaxID=4540 RepID=A0A3L6SKK6_PANMI|nr:uncharacterized protein C2845_PM07G05450 [Panicum miliaceum]
MDLTRTRTLKLKLATSQKPNPVCLPLKTKSSFIFPACVQPLLTSEANLGRCRRGSRGRDTIVDQHIDVSRGFAIGFDVPNVQELQLLMPSLEDDNVERVSACFEFIVFPILDCFFIRLFAGEPADASGAAASPTAGDDEPDNVPNMDILLDHLTLIKVVNIRGTRCELRLLRFLLNRAPALEQLVLVTVEEEEALGGEEMRAIQTRVSAMRTALLEARVTVCRPGEDDSQNPAHAKLYHEQ